MSDDLPDNCARGLRKKEFRDLSNPERPILTAAAFLPDGRRQGGRELSIDWLDDDGCLGRLRNRRQVAEWGVGVLRRALLDALIRPEWRGYVVLERAPLKDNPAHGNIVYLNDLPNPVRSVIAGMLAHHADFVAPPAWTK